jgi:hypothetical protein
MGVAKINGDRFHDFVDSEVQCLFYKNKSAENTQIPSPWLFFMGSHRSTHDSGIKRASYYSFKKFVRSPPRGRASLTDPMPVECNNGNALRNAGVVHTHYITLFCCVKVTSRHIMMRRE